MRINELILDDQLDEGIGQSIGKAWGGLSRGVGATVGGLAGTWQAAKQGYQAGKAAVTGQDDSGGSTAPAASSGGSTAPAASSGGSTVNVGQINKVIPTLRTRDLQSIKRTVDATIAKKGGGAASGSAAPAGSTAPAPNLQVQQGGKKRKSAPATGSGAVNLAPLPAGATLQAVEESKIYSKFLGMQL